MPLINRFSQLFCADFHALLDRLEDPETLLKQAIRDGEHELDRMRTRAQNERRSISRHEQTLEQLAQQTATADDELSLCIDQDSEKLARGVMRRKLELERQASNLGSKVEASRQTLLRLEQEITEGEAALNATREKYELMAAQPADEPRVVTTEAHITEQDIDLALMKARRERKAS